MARSGHVAQSFILLGLETKGGHWAASLGNILQRLINLVVIFSPLIPSENLLCFNPCLLSLVPLLCIRKTAPASVFSEPPYRCC